MKTSRIILSLVASAASYIAAADYIYWQIGEATFDTPSHADANFKYATVRAGGEGVEATETVGDASDYYKLYSINLGQTDYYKYPANPSNPNSTYGDASFFGSFKTEDITRFLFELWDADGKLVGYADKSVSELSYAISRSWTVDDHPDDYRPFVLQGVVPEPTSGILLILGVAGLALGRRRVV